MLWTCVPPEHEYLRFPTFLVEAGTLSQAKSELELCLRKAHIGCAPELVTTYLIKKNKYGSYHSD